MAQEAFRYTLNANLIFKWLLDPKYRPESATGSDQASLHFLPVEIAKENTVAGRLPQNWRPWPSQSAMEFMDHVMLGACGGAKV